jgi:hypothetical protein
VDALHGASTGIDDKFIVADFDESAGSEAIQFRGRRAGSQECNPKEILD